MRKVSNTNRLLSMALCLCMVLSLMPGIPLVANAAGTEGMITVEMADSYGDGWSDNAIEIYADGELLDTATIESGSNAIWTTSLDSHMTYTFRWVEGRYTSETSFVIYAGTEEKLSAKGSAYQTGDTIITLEATCSGTEYDGSFCCTLCGVACIHRKWTDGVCDDCGFICGTSAAHTWDKGVCTTCSLVCTHDGYGDGPCGICGGTCGEDYLHSFDDKGECAVCGCVCGVDVEHT